MRTRLTAAALLAGLASLAVPATSHASSQCISKTCYECVMYPCGPGDWVPFVEHRAQVIACDTANVCR